MNASPSAVGCIRCPIRAIRFEPRRDLLRFWWFTGVKFLFAKWVKIAPRRTPSAEGALLLEGLLGHLRLPEEPVGGSAAVPNVFCSRYLRAHDPGPAAYLSFLSPANEAIPHNLENGFPALPFPLSALQSHHYKAAEAGPTSRLRAWTPRPTERALTVNLCCSMSFTRTVRNARMKGAQNTASRNRRGCCRQSLATDLSPSGM